MKKQQGFTLIELMIVVAIIGVLSAIAIPAYKSYVTKSEATTAVSVVRGLLTNIDMYAQEHNKFPKTANWTDIGGATDMSQLGTLALADGTTEPYGSVTFTLSSDASLSGKKVKFTKLVTGWKCLHDTGETLKSCDSGVIQ